MDANPPLSSKVYSNLMKVGFQPTPIPLTHASLEPCRYVSGLTHFKCDIWVVWLVGTHQLAELNPGPVYLNDANSRSHFAYSSSTT